MPLSMVLDALLPDACVACRVSGPPLCTECAAEVSAAEPSRRDPTPRPGGLPPVTTAGVYEGPLRAALLAYKERGQLRLVDVLARWLAAAAWSAWTTGSPVVLVGVPSTRRARRIRGHDHVDTLVVEAVRALRSAGVPALRLRAVRHRGRVRDSTELDSHARARNAAGAFVVRRSVARRLAGRRVVVVDDIVTTGATTAAVCAALRAAGADVVGVAAIAATARRSLVSRVGEG